MGRDREGQPVNTRLQPPPVWGRPGSRLRTVGSNDLDGTDVASSRTAVASRPLVGADAAGPVELAIGGELGSRRTASWRAGPSSRSRPPLLSRPLSCGLAPFSTSPFARVGEVAAGVVAVVEPVRRRGVHAAVLPAAERARHHGSEECVISPTSLYEDVGGIGRGVAHHGGVHERHTVEHLDPTTFGVDASR